MNGRFKNYIIYVVASCSLLFSGFFDNSTIYGAANISTPYLNGNIDIADDYVYNFGIRKIALFPYQDRNRFYKGTEEAFSDDAIAGAVDGVEYLLSVSAVQNQGHQFLNQDYWLKWSNGKFITKFKYINKESRDLEFAEIDFRWRKTFLWFDFTSGYTIKAHPIYVHPAILDYEGAWWELAYDYGYTDYMVPETDLNDNGIIDDPYYVWIETDEETLEGYWILFNEGINYYWEDVDSNYVAGSDQEFYDYHYPHVVNMYNEDNKEKEWQAEASIVIGLDMMFAGENFYTHIWVNSFPKSYGLTKKAYKGTEVQYDVGLLLGTNLSEHIGVFIEGNYLSYYGKNEYNIGAGINWSF